MEAKRTDEIICGNCGRPNLPEAEKCWYCQIPLVKEEPSGPIDEEAEEASAETNLNTSQEKKAPTPEPEKDIPDWLKRVRELKARDTVEEEEEDQWRQQGLFAGAEEEPAPKPAHEPQHVEEKPEVKEKPEAKEETKKTEQQAPQPALDIPQKPEPEEKTEPESEESEEPPSEELPNGFIQFRPKNN